MKRLLSIAIITLSIGFSAKVVMAVHTVQQLESVNIIDVKVEFDPVTPLNGQTVLDQFFDDRANDRIFLSYVPVSDAPGWTIEGIITSSMPGESVAIIQLQGNSLGYRRGDRMSDGSRVVSIEGQAVVLEQNNIYYRVPM